MLKNEGTLKYLFRILKESFFIILGIIVAGFGLKGFLIPAGFIDGGVTGISLLLHFITGFSISILLFIINIPFIHLAKKQIGKKFAIKTFLAIIGFSLVLTFINYPIMTSDKLLVAVFGGFLLGSGIGLSVRGGGVLDGTEILSIYLNKKINLSIGEIIFLINLIIFSFAALSLGIEVALYSILTYIAASKTVDFIINGIEEYIGLTIISERNNEIREKLVNKLKKGLTIYKGKSGYSQAKEIDILFTVVTRLEVSKIKEEISSIDPFAVIIEQSIKEAKGGILKKRPLH